MSAAERVAAFGSNSTISLPLKSHQSAPHRVRRPLGYPAPLGLDHSRRCLYWYFYFIDRQLALTGASPREES
jgi:hypothetical protein